MILQYKVPEKLGAARFLPHMFHIPGTFYPIYEPVKVLHRTNPKDIAKLTKTLKTKYPGERYALLFAGASNYRQVNGLQYLYSQPFLQRRGTYEQHSG